MKFDFTSAMENLHAFINKTTFHKEHLKVDVNQLECIYDHLQMVNIDEHKYKDSNTHWISKHKLIALLVSNYINVHDILNNTQI